MSDVGSTGRGTSMPSDDELMSDVVDDLAREPMALYEVWFGANTLYPDAPMSARMAAAE